MAGVFDDVTFEGLANDLEEADPDHPQMVLFADPFLCSSVPSTDPTSLCNLRLMGAEDLIFNGNTLLEEDEDDLLLSAAIAMHGHSLPSDPAPASDDPKDLDEDITGRSTKERKENRKRKLQTGVGNAPTRYRPTSRNAARERSRVKSLRLAFLELQNSLPSVPPNTKLSKLDVLVLATTYIAHLMKTLNDGGDHQMATFEDHAQLMMAATATTPCAETPNPCISGVGSTERHHRLHEKGYLHPVRKWPMRSRLYAGVFEENVRCPTSGNSIPALALPDINYSMPLLDANLNVLFSFPN